MTAVRLWGACSAHARLLRRRVDKGVSLVQDAAVSSKMSCWREFARDRAWRRRMLTHVRPRLVSTLLYQSLATWRQTLRHSKRDRKAMSARCRRHLSRTLHAWHRHLTTYLRTRRALAKVACRQRCRVLMLAFEQWGSHKEAFSADLGTWQLLLAEEARVCAEAHLCAWRRFASVRHMRRNKQLSLSQQHEEAVCVRRLFRSWKVHVGTAEHHRQFRQTQLSKMRWLTKGKAWSSWLSMVRRSKAESSISSELSGVFLRRSHRDEIARVRERAKESIFLISEQTAGFLAACSVRGAYQTLRCHAMRWRVSYKLVTTLRQRNHTRTRWHSIVAWRSCTFRAKVAACEGAAVAAKVNKLLVGAALTTWRVARAESLHVRRTMREILARVLMFQV
jgi:hypothetical protein